MTNVVTVDPMTGGEIKELRKSMFLSQESFANLMGVSFYTVYRWETGKNTPSGQAEDLLIRLREYWNSLSSDQKFRLISESEMTQRIRKTLLGDNPN